MSSGSPTTSPTIEEAPLEEEYAAVEPGKHTRTVAMIKHHALDHRFDIESRISAAGFEVRMSQLVPV